MCGFIGCIHDEATDNKSLDQATFKQMNHVITHRGPDDEGYFEDEHIQFGFRRLSIIDIATGQQPLSYENERYWIIFNGEIYNFVELREELEKEGMAFQTAS